MPDTGKLAAFGASASLADVNAAVAYLHGAVRAKEVGFASHIVYFPADYSNTANSFVGIKNCWTPTNVFTKAGTGDPADRKSVV